MCGARGMKDHDDLVRKDQGCHRCRSTGFGGLICLRWSFPTKSRVAHQPLIVR